jgi:hypothetical protein
VRQFHPPPSGLSSRERSAFFQSGLGDLVNATCVHGGHYPAVLTATICRTRTGSPQPFSIAQTGAETPCRAWVGSGLAELARHRNVLFSASATTIRMLRLCSAPRNTGPNSRPRASPNSIRHGNGRRASRPSVQQRPPARRHQIRDPGTAPCRSRPPRAHGPARPLPTSPPVQPTALERPDPRLDADRGGHTQFRAGHRGPGGCNLNPAFPVRPERLLSRPGLTMHQPWRATQVKRGAQPPGATRSAHFGASMARTARTATRTRGREQRLPQEWME